MPPIKAKENTEKAAKYTMSLIIPGYSALVQGLWYNDQAFSDDVLVLIFC